MFDNNDHNWILTLLYSLSSFVLFCIYSGKPIILITALACNKYRIYMYSNCFLRKLPKKSEHDIMTFITEIQETIADHSLIIT